MFHFVLVYIEGYIKPNSMENLIGTRIFVFPQLKTLFKKNWDKFYSKSSIVLICVQLKVIVDMAVGSKQWSKKL